MKNKKIVSLILSIAIMCTMVTAFGVTASATAGTVPIQIDNFATLKSTIESATEPIEIDITKDISGGDVIYVNNGKDITINLKSHTVECRFVSDHEKPSTLTINGNGTIKGITSYFYCFDFWQGSTLIANNVKIIGGDVTGENEQGRYGITINNATAKLTNCYVSGGKSTGTAENTPAFIMFETAKAYVENCTFAKGTGGSQDSYYIVNAGGQRGKLYDFSGNEIDFTDDCKTPIVIGAGFAYPVEGDTITNTDGTPARGETPVIATTTIPEPTYTVTIPATLDLGQQTQALAKYRGKDTAMFTKDFNIIATGVSNLFDDLGKKPQLDVTVEYDGKLKGTSNGENIVPYELNVASGEKAATFYNDVDLAISGKTNTATMSVKLDRTYILADDSYTGTMTFTITIPDAE